MVLLMALQEFWPYAKRGVMQDFDHRQSQQASLEV